MNRNKLIAGAAVALFATLAAGTVDAATITKFKGTRDQVRAACKEVGGELIEGPDHTICMNNANGTSVTCDDAGNCMGSVPRTAADGARDVRDPLMILGAAKN